MSIQNEIWRNIEGYAGRYQVSTWGQVKSLNYNKTGQERILKLAKNKNGYLHVVLCKDGKTETFLVHRLVAEAFIPNPNNLPQVNHKDEDKENNHVSNLEWITQEGNLNYGTHNERSAKARTNGKCSKRVAQKTKDGELVKIWPSTKEVERQLGWSFKNISACCRGRLKSAYNSIWEFID